MTRPAYYQLTCPSWTPVPPPLEEQFETLDGVILRGDWMPRHDCTWVWNDGTAWRNQYRTSSAEEVRNIHDHVRCTTHNVAPNVHRQGNARHSRIRRRIDELLQEIRFTDFEENLVRDPGRYRRPPNGLRTPGYDIRCYILRRPAPITSHRAW